MPPYWSYILENLRTALTEEVQMLLSNVHIFKRTGEVAWISLIGTGKFLKFVTIVRFL